MRHLIAAAAGVLVLAATATAQQPTTRYALPAIPNVPAAAAGAPVTPVAGAFRNPSEPGKVRTFVMAGGGYFNNSCPIADPCSNGAGSLRSDVNFVLGSTKSFFNPCDIGSYGKAKCGGATIFGRGGSGFNPCQYDSYMNH